MSIFQKIVQLIQENDEIFTKTLFIDNDSYEDVLKIFTTVEI